MQVFLRSSWRILLFNKMLQATIKNMTGFHYMDVFGASASLHFEGFYDTVHLSFKFYKETMARILTFVDTIGKAENTAPILS